MNCKSSPGKSAAALAIVAALSGAAAAAPVSGSYQGTIERDNGLGLLGMTMVVDFTYDDSTAPGDVYENISTAMFYNHITSMVVTIGANQWTFDAGAGMSFAEVVNSDVIIVSGGIEDRFNHGAFTFNGPDLTAEHAEPQSYSLDIYLSDREPVGAPDALDDYMALPSSLPAAELFEGDGQNLMQFSFYTGDAELGSYYFIETGVLSSVSPVPLPAAFWLLAGGLAGTGLLRRRQRA
ncbi:MAG: VPLPA-CTERM sorting domain-containing protein [Gammaproteobacteria bacterium]|nr:VPLPA-CTERM sorting domain-containing protein [Gammaproteobacteria bacterium]